MKASFDYTYCVSENCKIKCSRHKDYYEFDSDKCYWFMEKCENYKGENDE